jgi:ERF superfamily
VDIVEHKSLRMAMLATQAGLPTIAKSREAKITTKDGRRYSYTFANLGDVFEAALPVMNQNGLLWSAVPTMDDGRLVLAYELTHVLSGESKVGSMELPKVDPQSLASAITYYTRYILCSLLGIVLSDEDDDGAKATRAVKGQNASAGNAQPSEKSQPLATEKQIGAIQAKWRVLGNASDSRRDTNLRISVTEKHAGVTIDSLSDFDGMTIGGANSLIKALDAEITARNSASATAR